MLGMTVPGATMLPSLILAQSFMMTKRPCDQQAIRILRVKRRRTDNNTIFTNLDQIPDLSALNDRIVPNMNTIPNFHRIIAKSAVAQFESGPLKT